MANVSQETLDNLPVNKLRQAIQTALDRGYVPDGIKDVTAFKVALRPRQSWVRWFNNDGQEVIQDIEHVIYAHSFAKALWGEEHNFKRKKISKFDLEGTIVCQSCGEYERDYPIECHLIHLQQMIVAPNPITYLGASL